MATLFFQVKRVTLGAVLEARLVIEPVMAGLAATRHDPELNGRLEEVVREHYTAETDAAWLRTTQEFHALVCGMSGNPLLNLLAGALKDIYTDRVSGFVFPEANRDHVRTTHSKIAKAIVKGDAKTSERLMREHMATLAGFFEERYPGLMDELVDWY
jgi:DNA-binding FadR family transcriptional regulator